MDEPKVFISHTSADHEFVYRLAADLERDGCDVWLDDVKIHIGDSLPDEIHTAIADAHFVVAVLSCTSVEKPWVRDELSHAVATTVTKEKGKRFILPCVIDPCELPPALKHRLYADFATQPYEEGYRKLLRTILPEGPVPVWVQAELIRIDNKDARVRRSAAVALGATTHPRAVRALMRALTDKGLYVRQAAAKVLGEIKDAQAVDALIGALTDKSPLVRDHAAAALWKIKDARGLKAVEKAGLLTGVSV